MSDFVADNLVLNLVRSIIWVFLSAALLGMVTAGVILAIKWKELNERIARVDLLHKVSDTLRRVSS